MILFLQYGRVKKWLKGFNVATTSFHKGGFAAQSSQSSALKTQRARKGKLQLVA